MVPTTHMTYPFAQSASSSGTLFLGQPLNLTLVHLPLTDQAPHLQRWQRSEARRLSAQAEVRRALTFNTDLGS